VRARKQNVIGKPDGAPIAHQPISKNIKLLNADEIY
jgi:hypothetical protein